MMRLARRASLLLAFSLHGKVGVSGVIENDKFRDSTGIRGDKEKGPAPRDDK